MSYLYLLDIFTSKTNLKIDCHDHFYQQQLIGTGNIKVEVCPEFKNTTNIIKLNITEQGRWQRPNNISFNNIYIWHLNTETASIDISHGRYGLDHLVSLVKLNYDDKCQTWSSESAHQCINDFYDLQMHLCSQQHLHLHWQVTGPKKSQIINSCYH